LRIDDANTLLGLRLNVVVMGVVLLGALTYLVLRRGARREEQVEPAPEQERTEPARVTDG
jgi:hypothetical protein